MSFENEIRAGFAEADLFAGESFTLSNHSGDFRGVFRGDQSPVSFDEIQGFDTATTNEVSVSKSKFTSNDPPMVNETLTNGADIYIITEVTAADSASWDIKLTKSNG